MRRGVRLKGIKVVRKQDGRRYLYRRVAGQLIALPDLPENDPRFLAAYVEAEKAVAPKQGRHAAGSIGATCVAFLGSHDFAAMAPSTRAVFRRLIDKIAEERGKGLLRDLRADHLAKDVRSLTPGAASNRLKAWRAILNYAVAESLIPANPAKGVKAPKGKTVPHRQWTDQEIADFRKHWPSGSAERQAFEVIYWTGARCVDAVTLGWQKVGRDGWLTYTQQKTSGPATCPVRTLPSWAQPLAADHAYLLAELPENRLQWIVTRTGKPRSVKGLSQWFSAAAAQASLPDDCTAHGLRKARAAALAEAGATASQIGAWTGHASLAEISHYTREADQRAILGAERSINSGNRIEKFPKPETK